MVVSEVDAGESCLFGLRGYKMWGGCNCVVRRAADVLGLKTRCRGEEMTLEKRTADGWVFRVSDLRLGRTRLRRRQSTSRLISRATALYVSNRRTRRGHI
jgi:hypothetical protein